MATGAKAGSCQPFGRTMADLWSRDIEGVLVEVQNTGGSMEKVRLLRTR